MTYVIVGLLVVVAYYYGRYKREIQYDENLKSLQNTADWWRERYEAVRPPEMKSGEK